MKYYSVKSLKVYNLDLYRLSLEVEANDFMERFTLSGCMIEFISKKPIKRVVKQLMGLLVTYEDDTYDLISKGYCETFTIVDSLDPYGEKDNAIKVGDNINNFLSINNINITPDFEIRQKRDKVFSRNSLGALDVFIKSALSLDTSVENDLTIRNLDLVTLKKVIEHIKFNVLLENDGIDVDIHSTWYD